MLVALSSNTNKLLLSFKYSPIWTHGWVIFLRCSFFLPVTRESHIVNIHVVNDKTRSFRRIRSKFPWMKTLKSTLTKEGIRDFFTLSLCLSIAPTLLQEWTLLWGNEKLWEAKVPWRWDDMSVMYRQVMTCLMHVWEENPCLSTFVCPHPCWASDSPWGPHLPDWPTRLSPTLLRPCLGPRPSSTY